MPRTAPALVASLWQRGSGCSCGSAPPSRACYWNALHWWLLVCRYILFAAEEQGFELPFACRLGCCTACTVKVKEGSMYQPHSLGLSKGLRDLVSTSSCSSSPGHAGHSAELVCAAEVGGLRAHLLPPPMLPFNSAPCSPIPSASGVWPDVCGLPPEVSQLLLSAANCCLPASQPAGHCRDCLRSC